MNVNSTLNFKAMPTDAQMTDDHLKSEAEDMMVGYTSKFVGLPVMKSQQISDIIRENGESIILVDVRTEEERCVSMLPTAISKDSFLSMKEKLPRDICIVPYCTIGHRSGVFGTGLMSEGFENVYNGEGIILWTHLENSQLVTGPGGSVTTDRVHTFGPEWDKVSSRVQSVHMGYVAMAVVAVSTMLGW